MKKLIDKLLREGVLSRDEFTALISGRTDELAQYAYAKAEDVRRTYYGNKIYVRGLIEFTNYCKNDCLYCGIRKSNKNAQRYRLSWETILDCCAAGYELGYRTYVLQGGEDPYWKPDMIASLVSDIKAKHPDCAVTLSLGEHPYEAYRLWRQAGADRYLLRHETADNSHYHMLHPPQMDPENRKRCLYDLKSLGYQVGAGFMVGAPYQTAENLADDFLFLKQLQPAMVGIGPFIPQKDTPFGKEPAGTLEMTLYLLALLRLMLPDVLLPATTALGTIHPRGRELGIKAGANVVMPNLSPTDVRAKYALYDNKICTGDDAAQCRGCLGRRVASVGCRIVTDRGDNVNFTGVSGHVCVQEEE